MSEAIDRRSTHGSRTSRRGQTLVEFALVLPMLIVLLLGIADFARVFQAGIVTEASARNGAEVAAIERLRIKPPPSTDPTFVDYYQHLHDMAAQAACSESRDLANTTYVADDPMTAMPDDDICAEWPIVAVCVHDGLDPICGSLARGYTGTVAAQCDEITSGWRTTAPTAAESVSIEVRTCYHFTTLMSSRLGPAAELGPLSWGHLPATDPKLRRRLPAGSCNGMLRRRAAARSRGQTMVEFALVAPLFFMLFCGIIVIGLAIFYQQQITNAAREGARFAAIHSATSRCPTVSNLFPDPALLPLPNTNNLL